MPLSLLSHNRSSSFIEQSQNEFQTIKDFFDWKIKQTTYESIIKQFTAVRQTVEDKAFKFKHLKIMSDPINFMHRKAIELGILDDMALNFAHDLKQFKQVWRSAQRLMDMWFEYVEVVANLVIQNENTILHFVCKSHTKYKIALSFWMINCNVVFIWSEASKRNIIMISQFSNCISSLINCLFISCIFISNIIRLYVLCLKC